MTLVATPLRLNTFKSQQVQGERSSRKRQCGEEAEARRKGQLPGQESEREEKRKGKSRQ